MKVENKSFLCDFLFQTVHFSTAMGKCLKVQTEQVAWIWLARYAGQGVYPMQTKCRTVLSHVYNFAFHGSVNRPWKVTMLAKARASGANISRVTFLP